MALIGVLLVVLGLELEPPLPDDLEFKPELLPDRLLPRLFPRLLPLFRAASEISNATNTIRNATNKTVLSRIAFVLYISQQKKGNNFHFHSGVIFLAEYGIGLFFCGVTNATESKAKVI